MKNAGLGIAVAAVVVAVLYWVTLSQAGVECEVCLRFHGREHCAVAAGASEAQAEQSATMAACGVLAGGVTDGIRCQAAPALSRRCTAR